MIKRALGILLATTAILGVAAYVFGDPGAAHTTWTRYNVATRSNDYHDAETLLSKDFLAFIEQVRLLALTASEETLATLPTLEVLATIGLREAVFTGHLNIAELRDSASGGALLASRRSPRAADMALLLVMPLAPGRATGWIGPKEFVDSPAAIAFAIRFGMRVNFIREKDIWRIDFLPAMRASADEHDAIGATGSPAVPWPYRKQSFHNMFAHANPIKQKALWTPLNQLPPAQSEH